MMHLNAYQIASAFPEEAKELIPKFLMVLRALEWDVYEKEKMIVNMPCSAQEKALYMLFVHNAQYQDISIRIKNFEKVLELVNRGYNKDTNFGIGINKAKLVPIEGLYDFQRIRITTSRFLVSCPFHGEDKHPSFVIYRNNNTFHCFTCKISGDAIDFFSLINKVKFTDAIKELNK